MAWERKRGRRVRRTAVVANLGALAAAVNRRGVNMTARQVACSGATISMLASGRLTSCSADLAADIAEALNLDLESVFTITEVSRMPARVSPDQTRSKKTA